jgi:hypothetical protein
MATAGQYILQLPLRVTATSGNKPSARRIAISEPAEVLTGLDMSVSGQTPL